MDKELKTKVTTKGVCDESFPNAGKQKAVVILDEKGCVANKRYQVVFVDEYNNWYLVGFFDNLEDAVPELNSYLEDYELEEDDLSGTPQFGKGTNLGELTEYASTFSPCFDRIINTTCGCVEVRGFVF